MIVFYVNMNVNEKQICRLCLNTTQDSFVSINEVIRQIFDVLLLKINLNKSAQRMICHHCTKLVRRIFHFKTTCIYVERNILCGAINSSEGKFQSKDIHDNHEISMVCRFCMKLLESNSFMSMGHLMNNQMFSEMFALIMPEIDLNSVKDPIICTVCKEHLECYYKFMWDCLKLEEKINRYCKIEGIKALRRRKLGDVLHLLCKDISNGSDLISAISQEDSVTGHETGMFDRFGNEQMKTENSEIKSEGISSREIVYNSKQPVVETNKRNFKNHAEINMKTSRKQIYKCSHCSHISKYNSHLVIHMLTHKNVAEAQLFKCTICTYKSKYKKSLKTHMLIHKDNSEVQMHKCTICTYESKYKYALKAHMHTHNDSSEIRLHSCPRCTYKAKQNNHLMTHMLTHRALADVEMHKCTVCTYESKYKKGLKAHMVTHKDASEVQMYKCAICVYETKYKNALKTHMITHKDPSELEMYKCDVCTFETKYKKNLKTHVMNHKNNL